MMAKSDELSRIVFLDYLRIFAFASVLIGHKFYDTILVATNDERLHATPRMLLELLQPFVYGGAAGVIVFFLVSGYIISYVLLREQSIAFLIRRAFRIYPLYVTAVVMQVSLEQGWDSVAWTTLLQQLLLVGDFFGAPYTLNGVEWTLRVEIVFYLFMALLKTLGFLDDRNNLLIYVLLATTLLLNQLPAFPDSPGLFKGYFLASTPFLFIGVGFFLYERSTISLQLLLLLIGAGFVNYWDLTARFRLPALLNHSAELGFLLFFLAWRYRSHFVLTPLVLLLSNLTFSVYLFHNWLLDDFAKLFTTLSLTPFAVNSLALVALFSFCYMAHLTIERPANTFGTRCSKSKKAKQLAPSVDPTSQ